MAQKPLACFHCFLAVRSQEGLRMERLQEEAQKTTSQIGVVFYVAAALSLAFIVWVVFFTTNFDSVTRAMLGLSSRIPVGYT